jgi:hypothetical protein
MATRVQLSGNTYPVKDELKALGCKWDADAKCWTAPADKADEARAVIAKGGSGAASTERKPFKHYKCNVCGVKADRYTRIYGSGECGDCYEERKMGY